ncbi:hypothetical protein BDR06DRAFT_1015016 [Suillus hirtellus]|nr:hypothetical protein BDR06DRAFT_1015016 [Suillus hirtellus]
MILHQADRDVAVSRPLSKVSEVYTFITEEELPQIKSMLAIYGRIAQQTLDFADFISHYFEKRAPGRDSASIVSTKRTKQIRATAILRPSAARLTCEYIENGMSNTITRLRRYST